MHPLLIFAGGLFAGIAGVRTIKNAKLPETARRGLETAEGGLRRATVSGLETLERSSAALRGRLSPDARTAGPGESDATAADPTRLDPAPAHEDPAPPRRRAAPPPDAPRTTAEKPRKRRRAAPAAGSVPHDGEPS